MGGVRYPGEGDWRPSRAGPKTRPVVYRIERGQSQIGGHARWKTESLPPPHPHKELGFWGRSLLRQK